MTAELVKVENLVMNQSTVIFGKSLIERFVSFAGIADSSRQTYTKCIKQLFKFFSANEIISPTRADLINWIEEMKAEGKSPSTIQLYLASVKIFFRWLEQEGFYANIADHLKSGAVAQPQKRRADNRAMQRIDSFRQGR